MANCVKCGKWAKDGYDNCWDCFSKSNPDVASKYESKPAPTKSSGNNRSFALSYAKDIAVAHIRAGNDSSTEFILKDAKAFERYLNGEDSE